LKDIEWAKSKGVKFIEIAPEELKRFKAANAFIFDWYIDICEKQGIGNEARKIVEIRNRYAK